jgi:hypothetical protein
MPSIHDAGVRDFVGLPLIVIAHCRHKPAAAPERDGCTIISTSSPARTIVRLHPSLDKAPGLPSSTVYVRPLNGPRVTSMYT